ncbi:phospholipase D-like domain-containing protein [Orbus mooreae]|uniref:phospholipase D-like domain-containing protein n=1 Tax=Orbus mooreae TaxID=3074107 RepID=UPI00370D517C
MNNEQITQLIAEIFAERQLSQEKREQLRGLELSIDQVRYMRNYAFDLVYQNLSTDLVNDKQLIKCLEQLIKTLDAAHTPPVPIANAYFSPGNYCIDKIQERFKLAKHSVDICVFTIADDEITEAIIDAHERGIRIRIITDDEKALDVGSDIDYLRSKGIAVHTDHSSSHMHHKFAIFDNQYLLNGSFNWTRSASRHNQENIIISNNKALISAYSREFNQLWQQFNKNR